MKLYHLPTNLPIPEDDGLCDHLLGLKLPELELPNQDGNLLINNDPYKGVTVDNGRLILPRTHGMGVSLIDNDTSLR